MQVNTSHLTQPTVKAALDAWQRGDAAQWQSYFTPDARLFDDGHPRDLLQFSTKAIGHERFMTIDKVTEGGLAVFGHFHSDQWGDFTTYFRFHLNADGKINRLDIGQANY